MALRFYWVGLCLVSYFWKADSYKAILGADPEKFEEYHRSDSFFTCFDGSKTIPISAINDDYCDCDDGSDEPGTSACPDGIFYCQNIGHHGDYIRSSRVNDGICDPECCDGSDEYSGRIQCPNNCLDVHKMAQLKKETLEKLMAKGSNIRKQYIEHFKVWRPQQEQRLTEVDQELKEVEITYKQLQEKRDLAQKEKEFSQETQGKNCIETLHKLVKNAAGLHRKYIAMKDILNDLKEKVTNDEKSNSDVLKDALIRVSQLQQPRPALPEESEIKEEVEEEIEEDWDQLLNLMSKVQWTEEKEYDAVVSEVVEIETKKMTLEEEKRSLEKGLTIDYGPEGEFAKLKGECITSESSVDFIYELCWFETATQIEKRGSKSRINLGQFKGWDEESQYSSFWHDQGTGCWNGPARSVHILLKCGEKNAILNVDEPNKCEYQFVVESPAACFVPEEKAKKPKKIEKPHANEQIKMDNPPNGNPSKGKHEEL